MILKQAVGFILRLSALAITYHQYIINQKSCKVKVSESGNWLRLPLSSTAAVKCASPCEVSSKSRLPGAIELLILQKARLL